jgi:hypothetical protein
VLSHYSPPITSSSPTASFVPTQIAGCALWLDAADSATVTTAGTNVTGWTDKTAGYTSTVFNSPGTQYVPNAIGSLPVIRIGATAAYFTFGNINNIGTNEFNIFAVFKASPITGVNSIVGKGSATTTGWWFGFNVSGSALQTQYNSGNITYTNTAGLQNYIIASSMNPRTSVPTHYYNGSSIGTGTANSTNVTNTSNLIVGSQDNNFRVTNTDFAEIIMYIGAISTAQREQIEGYLAWKWGLAQSLPISHPYSYYSNPPKISSPGGTETFGHSGTTAPQLENNNAIPAGGNTYALYGSFASADAFYGGNTFVCLCVRQNGVWTFTTNGQTYTTVAPNALKNLASGQYTVGVNSASGVQLGDVVVYNYALTAAERQQLEGYLMWKWGVQRSGNSKIAFPTTHPFYKYPPVTTLPLVNATQLYKKTFDVSDLGPALWLDANDPNTYVLDANNRVQWITNKGLGGLKANFTMSIQSSVSVFAINDAQFLSPGQAFEIASTNVTFTGVATTVSTPAAPVFFYILSITTAPATITISSTFGGPPLTGTVSTTVAQCYISQRFTRPTGTYIVTAASGVSGVITYTCSNTFEPGQLVTVTRMTPTGYNVVNQPILTSSSTSFTVAGGTTGTSTGTGTAITTTSLNGPLLTQSAVGTGNGLNYLDFSSGGTFRITGASTDALGTSVVLTLNATHGIPANRQVRVVVSGGTYSTNGASATGITNTYIVSAQTGTTITILYNSSQSSATINNVVGYVEYGSIIISDISMASGDSTAVFNTSFPHGLTTSDSIFLSLAGVTIAGVSVPLNMANGVYSVAGVTSTTFNVNLLNLGGSAIISTPGVSVTSLLSETSPSYAYFPYNGYCLENYTTSSWMISSSTVSVYMVAHTNPNSSGLGASSIARCGRNVETQPPIFATSVGINNASGSNGTGGGMFASGNGRDFNVRLANYNAIGSEAMAIFSVGNSITNATCSGTTATITFTNPSTVNPFTPGSSIIVSGTIVPAGYTNTPNTPFTITSITGNNQVSYTVASAIGDSTSVSGVTIFSPTSRYITPSIRLGTKRVGLSSTSVALTDTNRSVTNTANGFRVMTAQVGTTSGGTEIGSYSTAVTSCAWKPSNTILSSQPIPLMNTTYMNSINTVQLVIYQVSSTGSGLNATATFVPYSVEPTYNPLVVGQTYFVNNLAGTASGYNTANTTITAVTPNTFSYTTGVQQTAGTITGLRGFSGPVSGSNPNSPNHFRIGADTNATIGYNTAGGFLTDKFFDGGIAEILVFNTYLSEGQRMLVEGYLAQKYNCQDYIGATSNVITNGMSFSVGNLATNVTCSGRTATIIFNNPYSTNPFLPGGPIVVLGTISPAGYTNNVSTPFTVTSTSGTNQVSFSVASTLANATSVSGVTVSGLATSNAASNAANNQFIHPYSAGPANIASNLSIGSAATQTFAQNLALWYDAANYSSLTLNGTAVLTWSSRLGNVSYATSLMTPTTAGFNFKYVPNSQNGLPGLEVMSTVALTGVVLKSVTNGSSLLAVESTTPIVANQLITFATATSGIAINTYYVVRSGVTGTGPSYTFTVATSIGGGAVNIPVTTSGLSIQCQLFTIGLMSTTGITASTLSTVNTNNEFTYFYVLRRNFAGITAQTTQQIVSLGGIGVTRLSLVDNLFSVVDSTVVAAAASQTVTMNYATRGGLLNDTPMILCVYKRGRDLYSRMIGGGKTSQFVQTFSRDTQMPAGSGLQVFIGAHTSSGTTVGFNGTLYEMMIFRDALTDQAIQQTEGYLAQKWGLTGSLPQTHAYYEIKT